MSTYGHTHARSGTHPAPLLAALPTQIPGAPSVTKAFFFSRAPALGQPHPAPHLHSPLFCGVAPKIMIQQHEIIHQINCQPLEKSSLEVARRTSLMGCFITTICKPTTSRQGPKCLGRTPVQDHGDTGCDCLVGPCAF